MYGIIDGIQRGIINSVVQQGAGVGLQYMAYRARVLADSGSITNGTATSEFFRKLKEFGIYDSCKLAISPDFGIKTRVSGSNTFVSKGYSLVVPQARYGPELITNQADREFTSDTGFWAGAFGNIGINISGGTCTVTNPNTSDSGMYTPNLPLVVGRKYRITYTLLSISASSFRIWAGFTSGTARTVPGTYIEDLVVTTDGFLRLYSTNASTFSIDNISVVEVLNSLDGSPTDATQTTSTSQPHLGNIIAPNERPSLKNPNGQANYLTHPTISFAANEAWSVVTVISPFGSNAGTTSRILGNDTSSKTRIELAANGGTLYVYGETANGSIAMPNRKGKNTVLSLVYNGSGVVTAYVNGTSIGTISVNSAFTFNTLLRASSGQNFLGSVSAENIHSQALTPTQVSQLANYLMSKYPEIPSVTIGSQVWATSNCEQVASSNGTLIADGNVQATWASDAAAYWCHHTDIATGAVFGKLYNKKGRDVLIANPPSGWHVATKAELTALAANGGNALKKDGTTYWTTNGGTNTTGFTAIGGAKRNADGTFATIKNTATFWCADSDEVLLLNHNDNTATIVATTSAQGHSIRLVKG